jgi:hypothetical protein
MTNLLNKFLIYLSIYFCLTCFGLSVSPSSETRVQLRQWFNSPGYGVSARALTPYLCLVTGYDIGDEVGFVCGLFEFPADRNAMGLLVVAQQSWHKFCRNESHVQIVRQNSLNGPVPMTVLLSHKHRG